MNAGVQRSIGWGGIAIVLLVAAAAGALFLLPDAPEDDALTRLEAGGPIRIGYANEEPFGFLDPETGRVTGEAPEIARIVLARLGVNEIEPVVARFGELIPALKAGQLDIVAAGMYVTPKRCEEILFSDPSYRIGEGFIVRAGNPLALHAYEDVAAHATARLGVMGGAVQHGYARTLGIPEERIVVFEDYPTAMVGLATDRIDAIAATTLTVTVQLRKAADARFERAEPFRDPVVDGRPVAGYGAFGFRTDDEALRDRFNEALRAFLGTPEHLALVERFGFSQATLPGEATAVSLCEVGR